MKTTITRTLLAAILAAGTLTLVAQDGQPPRGPKGGPGGEGRPHRVPPIVAALDANHDGVIDAAEMANAAAVLKSLDKNGDGQLTVDELRPGRPEGAPEDGNGPGPGAGHRGGRGPKGHRPPPPAGE